MRASSADIGRWLVVDWTLSLIGLVGQLWQQFLSVAAVGAIELSKHLLGDDVRVLEHVVWGDSLVWSLLILVNVFDHRAIRVGLRLVHKCIILRSLLVDAHLNVGGRRWVQRLEHLTLLASYFRFFVVVEVWQLLGLLSNFDSTSRERPRDHSNPDINANEQQFGLPNLADFE